MYNGVLTLKLPKGVEIVGFAVDIVLAVVGETLEEVEMLATEAIDTRAEITVGENAIASKRVLKYLGVILDDRISFNSHVNYAREKAAKAINAIVRIMPNNSGPSSSKRRLLASVSSSILRYGGPAWDAALKTKKNQRKLNSTWP
ncbi:uncharacterized protein LOC135709723 [Ochlerotatus camptorhynchus]|uniref:uncharacterized protein LOC135709723 n=1 Tax=Ochlerotatus camptorhynchus TaxID=644619 RepID=UPI0031DDCFC3